ncbi:MAG TPA: hypothetical protein VEY71_00885 [Chitinophagales bacterium]|nr:hypothetical protein [Chitinophagales bacterium]
MQRIFPIAIPFLLLAIFLQSCATTGISKRHYGNSMYVKKERQKENTDAAAGAQRKEFNVDVLTALPKRMIERVGEAMEAPRAAFKTKNHNDVATNANTRRQAASPHNTATLAGTDIPIVHTVERNSDVQAAAADDGSAVFNILLIIGIILLVLGVIALLLDVLSLGGGWVGLIVVGLLLILIAYLVL